MSKEAIQYINATLAAFGPGEAISMTQETWAKLHESMAALAEQPAQQEPVATVTSETGADISMSWWHEPALPVGTTLYTTPLPAQRTWVGLTDEELSEVYNQADWDTVNGWEYERAIEATLRSKNEDRS